MQAKKGSSFTEECVSTVERNLYHSLTLLTSSGLKSTLEKKEKKVIWEDTIYSNLIFHLSPRSCLASAGVILQVVADDPDPDPQMSAISSTDSRLSRVDICVSLANLSLMVQVVTEVRKETRERTSRSRSRPPRRLNLKIIDNNMFQNGFFSFFQKKKCACKSRNVNQSSSNGGGSLEVDMSNWESNICAQVFSHFDFMTAFSSCAVTSVARMETRAS